MQINQLENSTAVALKNVHQIVFIVLLLSCSLLIRSLFCNTSTFFAVLCASFLSLTTFCLCNLLASITVLCYLVVKLLQIPLLNYI